MCDDTHQPASFFMFPRSVSARIFNNPPFFVYYCWWSGPYAHGIWNDGSIFEDGLVTHLEPLERVQTDRGYRGCAPQYVKCPDGLLADPDPAVNSLTPKSVLAGTKKLPLERILAS